MSGRFQRLLEVFCRYLKGSGVYWWCPADVLKVLECIPSALQMSGVHWRCSADVLKVPSLSEVLFRCPEGSGVN
jgi:hypothetical protein